MKPDWKSFRLGNTDVATVTLGQSPPSQTYNQAGEGLPFFQGKADFGMRFPKVRMWCSAPLRVAEPGDILISVRAPVGDVNIAHERCAIGRGLAAIRPHCLDKEFLYYALLHAKPRIEAQSSGSTFDSINRHTLESLDIPAPANLAEQRQIALILNSVQKAIETESAICDKLADLKSATMAKLFREGLRGEPLKQTEIGEIPESWEVVRLGDLALIERGKFAHRPRNDPRFYGGKIPFIQTGDVARARGRLGAYTQTLNDLGLNVSRVFPRGTIVITIAANIGDTAILDIDAAFPDSIIGITPTAAVDAQYLEFFLRTQKEKMNQLAPKGTQKNINIEFLRPWPIALPSTLDEQLRIADVLRTIEQRELRSRTSVSKLNELFSCLLHQLMTGAIRVKNLDLAGVSHA